MFGGYYIFRRSYTQMLLRHGLWDIIRLYRRIVRYLESNHLSSLFHCYSDKETYHLDKLGNENVYTIFQHVMAGDNNGRNKRPIRGGVFGKAFELNGNRPIGFELANSPFGKEPFDGIYEIKYKIHTGSYSDNFDGYLFLHPLANEPIATPLTEIFTDEFVEEMKRRASVMGLENRKYLWFGRPAPELTREYIINELLQE